MAALSVIDTGGVERKIQGFATLRGRGTNRFEIPPLSTIGFRGVDKLEYPRRKTPVSGLRSTIWLLAMFPAPVFACDTRVPPTHFIATKLLPCLVRLVKTTFLSTHSTAIR